MMFGLMVPGTWLASAAAAGIGPSMCPEFDKVQYSEPRELLRERVMIETGSESAGRMAVHRRFEESRSPYRTAHALVSPPDFKQRGPWTTVVAVRGNQVRDLELLITIRDHGSGGVKLRWLNEKLIWFRIWWGRVIATDMLLDVETGHPIYFEEADFQQILLDCEEKERLIAEDTPPAEDPD